MLLVSRSLYLDCLRILVDVVDSVQIRPSDVPESVFDVLKVDRVLRRKRKEKILLFYETIESLTILDLINDIGETE